MASSKFSRSVDVEKSGNSGSSIKSEVEVVLCICDRDADGVRARASVSGDFSEAGDADPSKSSRNSALSPSIFTIRIIII